jgi:predicted DsbA family dithiol-disulfide isomerase
MYANWVTWPNTTHCGRLLLLAEKHGLGDAVIGTLYRYCYEEGQNVSLREVVARAAVEVGVPGGAEYVHSDAGLLELSTALQNAKVGGKRVSAAPTFQLRVANAATSFSGAQETEQWLSMLEQCVQYAERAR